MDNLRSHVKTVHQGKAGIKILEPEEGDEVNIVTVASDDMVTLATEALAATAVTQLTGELGGDPRNYPEKETYPWGAAWGSWSHPKGAWSLICGAQCPFLWPEAGKCHTLAGVSSQKP